MPPKLPGKTEDGIPEDLGAKQFHEAEDGTAEWFGGGMVGGVLGGDYAETLLIKLLPALRTLVAYTEYAVVSYAVQRDVRTIKGVLIDFDALSESSLERMRGGADALDSQTNLLRAEILRKFYAWKDGYDAETRRRIVAAMRQAVADTTVAEAFPEAMSAVTAAIELLSDGLPEPPIVSGSSGGPYR